MSLNPDCEQGKHAACAGDAWDDDTDTPCMCECSCHDTAGDEYGQEDQ